MAREEQDIARRWCIFNCWGWPPDLPMPESMAERAETARREMAKAVRTIGMTRCLEYWNSEEFKSVEVVQAWGREPTAAE